MKSLELEVRQITFHGDAIFSIEFLRKGLSFEPGDCLALFGGPGEHASRPYSIASGTCEPVLRFLIRRMPDGEVSPWLATRQPGDRVRASHPFGWFRPGQAPGGSGSVFIATGTGIAPFCAYLHTPGHAPPRAFLWGVRRRADAVSLDWLRRRTDLTLAVSREKVPGAHPGRVSDLLPRLPIEPGLHFYLCGLDAMIDETTRWLEARGVPLDHIHRECFFNA